MLPHRLRRWPSNKQISGERTESIFTLTRAKLIYLNFQSLEFVSRYRDPQPEVIEKYSYLFNLGPNIYKSYILNIHCVPYNSDLIG